MITRAFPRVARASVRAARRDRGCHHLDDLLAAASVSGVDPFLLAALVSIKAGATRR